MDDDAAVMQRDLDPFPIPHNINVIFGQLGRDQRGLYYTYVLRCGRETVNLVELGMDIPYVKSWLCLMLR